ncbi:MAG: helix-hairpin-helix domain-containing protein [Chitinophagaceae bacterium]|nr:helix-hairpin-helix domain-containing protein [Chitinophagaceae bacterium]
MKKLFIFTLLVFMGGQAYTQLVTDPQQVLEQALEARAEKQEVESGDDESFLRRMQQFLKDPVNLNTATAAELEELQLLNPVQVEQFLAYRKLLGPLLSPLELQAIPFWDDALIRKMQPFITVSERPDLRSLFRDRIHKGEHQLLLRVSQVLERSNGYFKTDSPSVRPYPGSPQKIAFSYRYQYKQLLQWGLFAEKDAGEQFLKGNQKTGFDFYSVHLAIRQIGLIKTLIIGDYTVNLGQGLIQWQSLAFSHSADAMAIKREGEVFRPYHSAGEWNFHRGIALSLRKKRWEAGLFGSYRKLDANRPSDSAGRVLDQVTSFQSSGYHRTGAEISDKGVQNQMVIGGYLRYRKPRLSLGLQAVSYRFSLPVVRSGQPYAQYDFEGDRWLNLSADYGLTYKNLHLFGELAFTRRGDWALVQGLLMSVAPSVDISFLYRKFSTAYRSFYSSAFTRSADPENESGIYAGITVRPVAFLRVDAYVDFYRHPWLKYRVDAPSGGSSYFIQAVIKTGKTWELSSRYRRQGKPLNETADGLVLPPVVSRTLQNWRIQLNTRISEPFTLRSRVEMTWYDAKKFSGETGFLVQADLLFKPFLKPYGANARFQYFETDGYDSRIYTYENDVLYNFSVPAYDGKGLRYYININYEINKRLSAWFRYAATHYLDKTLIGSGFDEIKGRQKCEFRVQVRYQF